MPVPSVWFPSSASDNNAAMRLIAIPFAGGGASNYAPLRDAAPDWLDVQAAQLPGRESRMAERPFSDMDELIPALATAIKPLLDRPYALLGYSMGARIALNIAHQLALEGAPPPQSLIVAAHSAPSLPSRVPDMVKFGSAAFWSAVSAYEGTPPEVLENDELKELLEPLLRADFGLARYNRRASPRKLNIPIHAISGEQDRYATPDDMRPWFRETGQSFRLETIDSGHFFLKTKPELFLSAVLRGLQSKQAFTSNL
jgi:medium-chain acyl-[acyl-carrier-protein] hydrolase